MILIPVKNIPPFYIARAGPNRPAAILFLSLEFSANRIAGLYELVARPIAGGMPGQRHKME